MHFRLHSRYLKADERRGNAITFVLRHVSKGLSDLMVLPILTLTKGDILVMDGDGVQEFYE